MSSTEIFNLRTFCVKIHPKSKKKTEINVHSLFLHDKAQPEIRRNTSFNWLQWDLCILSGVITTTGSFDRERQREFTLSVTATDQAEEPLIGICQITVLISDENDNDPKFENSRYQCKNHCHISIRFLYPLILFLRKRSWCPSPRVICSRGSVV